MIRLTYLQKLEILSRNPAAMRDLKTVHQYFTRYQGRPLQRLFDANPSKQENKRKRWERVQVILRQFATMGIYVPPSPGQLESLIQSLRSKQLPPEMVEEAAVMPHYFIQPCDPDDIPQKKPDKSGTRVTWRRVYALRDRKWLTVEIDITAAPEKRLATLVQTHIHDAKASMGYSDRRQSDESWSIYDMRYTERLSVIQIAQRITGILEDPKLNEIVHARCEAIRRALNKMTRQVHSLPYPPASSAKRHR